MQNKSLIKKEFWVLDQACKLCDLCLKPFNLIARRKHHCRQCGKVFCEDCSNNFVEGSFFQLKDEDRVRFCTICFDQAILQIGELAQLKKNKRGKSKLIRKKPDDDIETSISQSSMSVVSSDPYYNDAAISILQMFTGKKLVKKDDFNNTLILSSSESTFPQKDTVNDSLLKDDKCYERDSFLTENTSITIDELKNKMLDKIETILCNLVVNHKTSQQWIDILRDFSWRAVQDIKIDSCAGSMNSMDINDYVKIKRIPFVNSSATEYIRGIVCRKNIAYKKMQSEIDRPKIMVIYNSLDLDNPEAQLSFQDILNKNESKLIKGLIEKIQKIGPNIIFVEKHVNIIALQELQKRNISVAQLVKAQILSKICKTTGAKGIRKISEIEKYENSSNQFFGGSGNIILGQCERIVFKGFDPETIINDKKILGSLSQANIQRISQHINKKRNKDNTLLFLTNKEPNNCITITLSGPNCKELEKLKYLFRTMIKMTYHLKLEKEMISIDLQFQRKLVLNQQINMSNVMVTCGAITDFIYSKVTNVQEDFLEFSQVKYTQGNLKNFPDIDNITTLNSYITDHQENFNQNYSEYFSEMCEVMPNKQIKFYSRKDMPLGEFILNKCENKQTQCLSCKSLTHTTVIYGPNVFVKIFVENNNQKNLIMKKLYSKSTFQSLDTNEEFRQTLNEIKQEQVLKKKVLTIETFLECEECHEKVSEQLVLRKPHLEYSLYRFIQHLLITCHNQRKNNLDAQRLINQISTSSSACKHQQIARVFLHDLTKVKFYSNVYKSYTIRFLQFLEPAVIIEQDKITEEIIKLRKQDFTTALDEIKSVLTHFIKRALQNYSNSVDGKKSCMRKTYQAKLEELVKESLLFITTTTFKDHLSFEWESMKLHTKFNQLQWQVKQTQKQKDDDVKASLVIKSGDQSIKNIEIQPSKEGMLGFLINTKVIDREIMKHQHHKGNRERKHSKPQSSLLESKTRDSKKLVTIVVPFKQPEIKQIQVQQVKTITEGDSTFMGTSQDLQHNSSEDKSSPEKTNDQQQDKIVPLFLDVLEGAEIEQGDSQYIFNKSKKDYKLNSLWPRYADNFNEPKPLGPTFYPFIPLYKNDDIGSMAYALNSPTYYSLYQKNGGFHNYEGQTFPNLTDVEQIAFFENILMGKLKIDQVLTLKVVAESLKVQQTQTPTQTNSQIVEEEKIIVPEAEDLTIQKRVNSSLEIILYYPVEFEAVRMTNNISIYQLIKSLSSCESWDSSGGKSGSSFYKSADKLMVFKQVKESEFFMLDEFAPKYFEYVFKTTYQSQPSVLNKVLGMFEIQNTKGYTYWIAMESLFYGMPGDCLTYDLKGSELKRWNRNKKGGNITYLDTNYRVDRNGEPLPIDDKQYSIQSFRMIEYLSTALIEDSDFLFRCRVVDYSLLLVIDMQNNVVKMGIIDYLQQFNLKKHIENRFKKVINLGLDPTIVPADIYRDRFQKWMKSYFMEARTSFFQIKI